jgi:hypothetical protein
MGRDPVEPLHWSRLLSPACQKFRLRSNREKRGQSESIRRRLRMVSLMAHDPRLTRLPSMLLHIGGRLTLQLRDRSYMTSLQSRVRSLVGRGSCAARRRRDSFTTTRRHVSVHFRPRNLANPDVCDFGFLISISSLRLLRSVCRS